MSKEEEAKKAQIAKQLAEIKANKELLNALKNDAEISANLSELKSEYSIQINKWGDLHLKKNMLQSLKHFANLDQLRNLKMRFEKDKIIIEKAEKY